MKVCFLISNDFGELNLAVAMTTGADLEALFLVPERLERANPALEGSRMACYTSAFEIAAVLERESPQALILCSGYLLLFCGNIDLSGYAQILGTAQGLGCRVLTTDPFLGYWGQALMGKNNALQNPRYLAAFEYPAQVLHGVPHLYVIDPGPNIVPDARAVSVSAFYEQEMDLSQEDNPGGLPQWLFVLSAEDHRVQITRWNKERFHAWLAARLDQTEDLGRQPVLIAPDGCLAVLKQRWPASARHRLLPFCEFDTFRRLSRGAEYSFYWNPMSNTLVERFMRQQPFFCFDNGHIAQALPDLFAAGIRTYYGGVGPGVLRLQDPVNLEALKAQAERERLAWAPAREKIRRAQPLRTILADVLSDTNARTRHGS
jgi:hypothetical protein